MNSILKQMLTEVDNQTYEVTRVLAVASVGVAIGLAIYAVVVKGQPFDVQNFGIGIGAVFVSVGAALRLKRDDAPSVTATSTTTTTETAKL